MTKKVKVAEATNLQLDWMVCKAGGGGGKNINLFIDGHSRLGMFNYTTDWSQMGPIIEREFILLTGWRTSTHDVRLGGIETATTSFCSMGPTSLIAAARCYVASKFGDIVEVPEELS